MSIEADGEKLSPGHGFYDVEGRDSRIEYGSAFEVDRPLPDGVVEVDGLFDQQDAEVAEFLAGQSEAARIERNGHDVPTSEVLAYFGLLTTVEAPLLNGGSTQSPSVRP